MTYIRSICVYIILCGLFLSVFALLLESTYFSRWHKPNFHNMMSIHPLIPLRRREQDTFGITKSVIWKLCTFGCTSVALAL